jgi:rfaE bifunctional protein kinase chain/domain
MTKSSVFVSGIFNVLHPGHLRLFKYARDHGEHLVVGVLSDELAGPDAHVPEGLRLEAVKLNALVDDAFLVTTSVADELRARKPAVVVKGKEYAFRENSELEIVSTYGGRLLFSSGDVTFTSQDLIRREMGGPGSANILMPRAFLARHRIDTARLVALVQNFPKLRAVIVGDTIIDEYVTCEPLGLSGEDPTVVVTPISTDRFAGGAAVVSAHGSSLGAQVDLVTVVGDDEVGEFAVSELDRFGVNARTIRDDSRPTTLKQRFRANEKTLLRVSRLSQRTIDPALQEELCREAEKAISSADLLIFSDFNYGVLPQAVVDRLSTLGAKNGLLMAADSQSSSQIGDISRFRGMSLLAATERETRLALKDSEGGVNTVANGLLEKTGSQHLLMKLGADGAIILRRTSSPSNYEIDQIPAFNQSPRDVAGAGDSMLVVASLALASGASIWEASVLASLAAAVQVSRVGNIPLRPEDLLRALTE